MDNNILDFHLSDNEFVIRSYECTKLLRFFAPSTFGYLTITNMRIVYHSQVNSGSELNAVISEIPLNDVSGLNASISASFSWLLFFLFYIVVNYLMNILVGILPEFMTGWVGAILMVAPYLIYILFEKNILSQDVKEQIIKNFQDIPGKDLIENNNKSFYISLFQFIFYFGLALLARQLSYQLALSFNAGWPSYLLQFGAYFVIYKLAFGKMRTFTLAISARSAKDTGIVLPSTFLTNLLGGEMGVLQAIFVEPGSQAELIVHELGAMLTDIRQMGDFGIQKWMR